jgi:hypothetical protein
MEAIIRTTLTIDDALLAEYKRVAADTHRTLSYVIQDALRETLARRREAAARQPVRLPVIGGGGVQPGVDMDDNARVLELLEADRDAGLREGLPSDTADPVGGDAPGADPPAGGE